MARWMLFLRPCLPRASQLRHWFPLVAPLGHSRALSSADALQAEGAAATHPADSDAGASQFGGPAPQSAAVQAARKRRRRYQPALSLILTRATLRARESCRRSQTKSGAPSSSCSGSYAVHTSLLGTLLASVGAGSWRRERRA